MLKRRTSAALAIALSAAAVAGCSSGDSKTASPRQTATAATSYPGAARP